jgi:hypothetical protein
MFLARAAVPQQRPVCMAFLGGTPLAARQNSNRRRVQWVRYKKTLTPKARGP